MAQLPPDHADPIPATTFSFVRTPAELSLVLPAGDEPPGAAVQTPWAMLEVIGPLDFSLTGVIARISASLAAANVPVFVLSSYDTDYVLLPADEAEAGIVALERDGMPVARVA